MPRDGSGSIAHACRITDPVADRCVDGYGPSPRYTLDAEDAVEVTERGVLVSTMRDASRISVGRAGHHPARLHRTGGDVEVGPATEPPQVGDAVLGRL